MVERTTGEDGRRREGNSVALSSIVSCAAGSVMDSTPDYDALGFGKPYQERDAVMITLGMKCPFHE